MKLNVLVVFATSLIRLYKVLISPFLPGACRHYPSCSTYAIEALETYGPLKGSMLALRRILRCHPFSKGGYDPVCQHKVHE